MDSGENETNTIPRPSSTNRRFMRSMNPDDLQALTSAQKGIISTMRHLQQDDSLSIENLKQSISEMYPPAALFSQEPRSLPALYSELRDFMDSCGANMTPHSSRRVMMTLATNLYSEPEDTLAATDIVRDVIAAGRRRNHQVLSTSAPTSDAPPVTHPRFPDLSSEKVAHNVAMWLKENEKKFSGDLGENWMEFVNEYTQIARDYKLSLDQRLQYLHNILRGDAKRFYLDRIDGYASTYQQAVDMINDEYNSPVRQTRVKNYLNSLRLGSFEAKGIETSAALSQIYKIITKFSRQAPRSHHGDAHKIEFLRNAVVGYPWSHEPLSRVPTHNLTFQMLYGELEAALQLYKEAKLAMLMDRAENGKQARTHDPSSIFYQGQCRYLKDASIFRRERNNASIKKQKKQFDPLSIQGCFNCDSPDHMIKQCPRPLNIARAASRKIDYYAKKDKGGTYAVHQVLADLCLQLDGSTVQNREETEGCTDVEVFQMILGGSDPDDVVIPEITEPTEASDAVTNIYVINYEHANVHETDFLGACIDSAAQKTVIGKPQAELYSQRCGIPFKLEPSVAQPSFMFGTHGHPGLGKIAIRLPIATDHFLLLKVDVVNIDIPFFLVLDTMTNYGMVLDAEGHTLSSKFDCWEVPLIRKRGHLYYEWYIEIFFTEAELRKMHKHFFHPQAEKLYSLLRRADPDTTSPKVLQDLERIGPTCDPCQRMGTAPHRFKVSLPLGDIVFNRKVCIDIMSLNQRPVLHAVDRDTKFNAARFLNDETAETAWNTFREMWVSTYVGYPDIVSVDQGPQFRSKHWPSLTKLAGVTLKSSGVA